MTTDMQAALQACVDAMLHDGVPTDPYHPRRVALNAAEAALASRPDAQADERGAMCMCSGLGPCERPGNASCRMARAAAPVHGERGAPTLWEAFEMGFGLRSAMLGHVLDGRDVGRLTTCEFWHPALHDMHIGTDLHVGLTVGEAIVRLKNEVRRRLDALVAAAPQAIVKGDERMTQWQFRTKTTTSEPAGTWRNGSEEGINRLIAKHPNFYEVRALVDRAAAPQAEAAQGVAPGMKLVPIEPTEEQQQAGAQYAECGIAANAVFCYRAMLAAAPSLDREQVGEREKRFECAARKQGTAGGNNPAECDWPMCGCDEHATRVIESLQESGHLRDASPSRECGGRQGETFEEWVERYRQGKPYWSTARIEICRDAWNAALAASAPTTSAYIAETEYPVKQVGVPHPSDNPIVVTLSAPTLGCGDPEWQAKHAAASLKDAAVDAVQAIAATKQLSDLVQNVAALTVAQPLTEEVRDRLYRIAIGLRNSTNVLDRDAGDALHALLANGE